MPSDTRYRAIFDLLHDAIFLHDPQTGAIVDINRRMTELYGYTRDEALRLSVADLSAGDGEATQARALQLLHDAAAGVPQLFEWLAKHRDGGVFWVEVNLKAIVLEGEHRLLAIVRDITARKRAEDSLRAADEQLREQAALVRLGEMAAVVAHEVRNPLAGVRGAIEIVGRRLPPASRDAAVIAEIIARLDALDELMGDLLLFARPPQARPQPVDLAALAREAIDFVAKDPAGRDVHFEVAAQPAIASVDPKLLRIVLLNLLLNAAHAVQSVGVVRVLVSMEEATCRIAVVDRGPGIPVEIRDRIFVPFFTTKSRGTGLGLPTAKRLVEAHSGRLVVDCPDDGGTVVTIELPRSTDRPSAAAAGGAR